MATVLCKDCIAEGITAARPVVDRNGTPYPGPRCATHNRAEKKRRRARSHERRIATFYEMEGEIYWMLYRHQGGLCPICHRARGVVRRLAVDHDHSCTAGHPPERGCPQCWRGLLCGQCNQLLGRYPLAALQRAVEYLTNPPAQQVLRVIST